MSDALTSDEEQIDQRRLTAERWRPSRVIGWVALAVLALQLVVFRLSGELREALPGELFMVLAFFVEVLAGWLRWPTMSRLHDSESVTRLPPWPGWMDEVSAWWRLNRESLLRVGRAWVGGAVVVVLLIGALSLSKTGAFALIGGWLCVLWLEGAYFAFGCGWRRIPSEDASATAPANQEVASSLTSPAAPTLGSAELVGERSSADDEELKEEQVEADAGGDVLPANVVQLTTRSQLQSGGEAVEQFVRCTFADADPLHVVHVAFCPPLAAKPTLDVDQLEGPEATIKTTLAEAFGARLEVRLAEPAELGGEVMLRIYAVA